MKAFRHILHVIDPSPDESARRRAIDLAIDNKAALTLMSVVERLPRALGMTHVISDTDELQRAIAADRLLGSVSQSLMRLAPCPVWLLKPSHLGQFDCIVAAIDATSGEEATTDLNRNILELADSIAKRERAVLHVVSAWGIWMETPLRAKMGDMIIDDMATEFESCVRCRVDDLVGETVTVADIQKHVHRGAAADKIRELVEHVQTDLLVMGTQCRTGAAGIFIGNTAEAVLSGVKCSVLTVKPNGFVSPIERDLKRSVIRENADPIYSIFNR